MSKDLFQALIDEIQSGSIADVESKIADLSEEQLDALFNEAQPFKALATASSNRIVLGSVSNLREKYLKKLITTAMVSFLFQMKDEFTIDEDNLITPLNKGDFFDVVDNKAALPDNFISNNIYSEELTTKFLATFPKKTKSLSFKEMNAQLSEDQLLEVSTKANDRFNELTKSEKGYNGAKYNDALEKAIEAQSVEERQVINRFLQWLFKFSKDKHAEKGENEVDDDPERKDVNKLKGADIVYDNIRPNDTHCRFKSYYEINYKRMCEATHNICNVKPDLKHVMIVYNVVDSQDEENREHVDYYNKHNSIIKGLLQQQEQDAALGEELMKKRIKSKKVKAEKIFGKDSPQFEEYRKLNPSELEQKYGAKMEKIDEDHIKITREVMVDTETGEELKVDADGVPINALEIPITSINAETGETTQTRNFTQSDDK